MPLPRSQQVSLIDTPYYHCVSRCVCRAFLCGKDKYSGKSFEHRRQWVENRLLFLGTVFCIDICAYAVMSNHTHVVLHVDNEKANNLSDLEVAKRWQKIHKSTLLVQRFVSNSAQATTWSTLEVVTRWHQLFKGTLLTQQYARGETLPDYLMASLNDTVAEYRKRLIDISWFMRLLNESVARQANREDNCTGHFWEGAV